MRGRDTVPVSRKKNPSKTGSVLLIPMLDDGNKALAGGSVKAVKQGWDRGGIASKTDVLEE